MKSKYEYKVQTIMIRVEFIFQKSNFGCQVSIIYAMYATSVNFISTRVCVFRSKKYIQKEECFL